MNVPEIQHMRGRLAQAAHQRRIGGPTDFTSGKTGAPYFELAYRQ